MKRIAVLMVAWGMCSGLVWMVLWGLAKLEEPMVLKRIQEAEKIRFVFELTDMRAEPKGNDYYKNGDYNRLVDWMEQEFLRFDRCIADLGGVDEVGRKAHRSFRGTACGFCELYCGLHFCVDYNARYTPRNVEVFLMLVHESIVPYTSDSLRMFELMGNSNHPIVKAYGLWFLKQAECKKLKIWNLKDMDEGRLYPAIQAFQNHVYEYAMKEAAWAYGFAVDASKYDSNMPRVIDCLYHYHAVIAKEWWARDIHSYLDGRLFSFANRPGEEFDRLNPKQKSFINHRLDFQLLVTDYKPYANVPRMFQIMHRRSDIPAYQERLQLAELIQLLQYNGNRPRRVIIDENANRMHLLERFMDQCLWTGDSGGYHPENLRAIFEIMGRKEKFDRVFPARQRLQR